MPFWGPFITSLLIAIITTPLAIKVAWKFGLVDNPKRHKHAKVVHTYPVPRGGGIPIFISLLIGSLLWIPFDVHVLGILAGAAITMITGLFDDKYNISPYIRLVSNISASLCVLLVGIGIAFINNPFGGIINLNTPEITLYLGTGEYSIWVLADIFAIIWIVAMMNMVGIGGGGIEGQLPGIVLIAGIVISLLSLEFSSDITQWSVITLSAITAGAYAGFLPWNFFPQKIMPGYSGKSLAGFLLAVLAILSTAKVGTTLVVLGLPIIDTSYAFMRRIINGKSPIWGDRSHLHHRLLDAGIPKAVVVFIYWGITVTLGIVALNLNSQQKVFGLVTVILLIGIALTVIPESKHLDDK